VHLYLIPRPTRPHLRRTRDNSQQFLSKNYPWSGDAYCCITQTCKSDPGYRYYLCRQSAKTILADAVDRSPTLRLLWSAMRAHPQIFSPGFVGVFIAGSSPSSTAFRMVCSGRIPFAILSCIIMGASMPTWMSHRYVCLTLIHASFWWVAHKMRHCGAVPNRMLCAVYLLTLLDNS